MGFTHGQCLKVGRKVYDCMQCKVNSDAWNPLTKSNRQSDLNRHGVGSNRSVLKTVGSRNNISLNFLRFALCLLQQ